MTLNESDFRHCLGNFATGVTVITTQDSNGNPQGVTINSFSSLSLEPPLVLFSLDKNAHTHEIFHKSKYFLVNILSEKQQRLSEQFVHPSHVEWNNVEYEKTSHDCPLLNGNIAYIECMVESIYDGGDHSLFIGKVLNLESLSDEKPLLYFKGNYTAILD